MSTALRHFPLRAYQERDLRAIEAAWAQGQRNVVYVCPTGGGKTVTLGTAVYNHPGWSLVIAHRSELISQMSVTLARMGIRHRIFAPVETIGLIVRKHIKATGNSYYDVNARCAVASIDTLARRDITEFAARVSLWVIDEGHHVLLANKWGKAMAGLPENARGLLLTATPTRADGRGLGRHADGVADCMVLGPTGEDLIAQGYLTPYLIYTPHTDFNRSAIAISPTTGELVQKAVIAETKRSHITGDLVEHYLRLAPGEPGLVFTASVELAIEQAAAFRAAGVRAEAMDANTPGPVRDAGVEALGNGGIDLVVNVGLFGEGTDVPAVSVVIDGGATESYGNYAQRFGRMLRVKPGKTAGKYIDAVGNVMRHAEARGADGAPRGLPTWPQSWTLDRREKRGKAATSLPTIKACPECTSVYERALRACPYCGHEPVPMGRTAPDQVDGDLVMLDPAALRQLQGAAARIDDQPAIPYNAPPEVRGAIMKRHRVWREDQMALRRVMAWWGGWQSAQERDDRESQRRFFLAFGVDVLTAQGLKSAEANDLRGRIEAALTAAGVKFSEELAA